MSALITEGELAERLRIDAARAAELRRSRNWPHVRLSRFDVRYTEAQVEQVLQIQTVAGKPKPTATGQTAASARRSA